MYIQNVVVGKNMVGKLWEQMLQAMIIFAVRLGF